MAYTAAKDWAAGTILTAADMDTYVSDNTTWLKDVGLQGLELRVGSAVVTTDANGEATVTYDSAFATSTTTLVAMNGDSTSHYWVEIKSTTASGFTFLAAAEGALGGHLDSTQMRVNYIALGS